MARDLETRSSLDGPSGSLKHFFHIGQFEIGDGAAFQADQVVMVIQQAFVQLEPSETFGEFQLQENLGVEKIGNNAVKRGERHIGSDFGLELRNGERCADSMQGIDNRPAAFRPPLTDACKATIDLIVHTRS